MIGLRFFPLKSADVRGAVDFPKVLRRISYASTCSKSSGAGTRDEPLRTSVWEATNLLHARNKTSGLVVQT